MSYTYQTYPTAFVQLETGTYTRQQLQDSIDQIDALNTQNKIAMQTQPIATPDVMRQARWMPIPKPLTEAYIDDLCDEFLLWQIEPVGVSGIHKLIRAIEKAHGIGEKDE